LGGTCPNGILALHHTRTEDDHCGSCGDGYFLKEKACHAFAGKHTNGNLIFPQRLRTEDDHCGTCDPGYFLDDKKCLPHGGACGSGTLISQSERTQENQCGSCDLGYVLNADHRCGTCLPGHVPKGNRCQRCRNCFWAATGASQCNPCDYVLHAIDTENCSGCDLPSSYYQSCPFNPFIYLASKHGLSNNWNVMVEWLHKRGFDVNMEDPRNRTLTPVVAAVEHCKDSSDYRGKMMQGLVMQWNADTLTGLPSVTSQTGCDEKWHSFLATHPQGLNWMQKWERLVSSMGFRQSITIAISVGLVVGLFLHLPFVCTTEEHVSRGALQLAATALYPVRLAWFHYFMCYLAVIANIIWPFLILKSLIQKWLFVGVYAGIVWMPAVCIRIYVLRSWQPDRPAFAALPLAYGLHKKQTTLGFHVFTVVRLIILCCLAHSVGHSNTDNFQKMENVTVFPVRQFYHFKASLSNSRMSESEKWLVNTYTTLYCNPSHLPRWVAFPSGTHWMLPQRGIFYTFRGSVEIMTMLWGVMTLCVLPWPCKQKRIDAQEETALFQDTQGMQADPLLSTDEQKEPVNNIEELVNQIEQAAAQGRNLEELTGERELNESLFQLVDGRYGQATVGNRRPACGSRFSQSLLKTMEVTGMYVKTCHRN